MRTRISALSILSMALLCACSSAQMPANASQAVLKATGVTEDRELAAINKLMTYYNSNDGSWNTPTGEAWQPALSLDAIINIYQRTGDARFKAVMDKSFARYLGQRSNSYDDDGWYMNTWLRAWDVTSEAKYIQEAQSLFSHMAAQWDTTCGGGVWWSSARNYKNAITNELFLLGAARLHRRSPNGTGAGSYSDWTFKTWNWFNNSGMINAQNRVNDGLNSSCQNNGEATWTYNQGVILGALVEMWRIGGDRGYLAKAENIALATVNNQVWPGGILKEAACEDSSCGGADHFAFKGPFVQGVARLVNADRNNPPQQTLNIFLNNNANSVWNTSRDSSNGLGFVWKGPVSDVNSASQSAAALLLGGVSLLANGGEVANPPIYSSSSTLYEAESATRYNLGVESIHAGYTGSGYLAGWNSDDQWVDFTVNRPSSGSRTVTLRYAAGAGDAYRYIYSGGAGVVARLKFPGTGSWSSYNTVSVTLPMNSGNNSFAVIYSNSQNSANWLNLDNIVVN